MTIAIIGTGNMASGLARNFARAGYGVVLGARDAAKGRDAASALGVQGGSIADAARQAEVIFLAVPFDARQDVVPALGDTDGKVLVDLTNPITPDHMALTIGFSTSAAEEIQALAPRAKVVKAFNTVLAQVLAEGPNFAGRMAPVFIAADAAAAKATVSEIAARAGFDPVDAGPLKNARYLEPLAELNIQFAYELGHGPQIVPAWLKR